MSMDTTLQAPSLPMDEGGPVLILQVWKFKGRCHRWFERILPVNQAGY